MGNSVYGHNPSFTFKYLGQNVLESTNIYMGSQKRTLSAKLRDDLYFEKIYFESSKRLVLATKEFSKNHNDENHNDENQFPIDQFKSKYMTTIQNLFNSLTHFESIGKFDTDSILNEWAKFKSIYELDTFLLDIELGIIQSKIAEKIIDQVEHFNKDMTDNDYADMLRLAYNNMPDDEKYSRNSYIIAVNNVNPCEGAYNNWYNWSVY